MRTVEKRTPLLAAALLSGLLGCGAGGTMTPASAPAASGSAPSEEPSPSPAASPIPPSASASANLPSGAGSAPEQTRPVGSPAARPAGGVLLIVLATGGGASAVAGAVLLVGAEKEHATARQLAEQTNHRCPVHSATAGGPCAELRSAAASTDLLGNLGIGALVVGGLLGAGATAVWVVPRRGKLFGPRTALTLTPFGGTAAGGVLVQGSF